MLVKQFLLNSDFINRTAVARLMYPNMKSPKVYISHKLSGVKNWSEKDEKKALVILKKLADDINKLG